jgi:hypothetical protein
MMIYLKIIFIICKYLENSMKKDNEVFELLQIIYQIIW